MNVTSDLLLVKVEKVLDASNILTWAEGLTFFWPTLLLEKLKTSKGDPFALIQCGDEHETLKIPSDPAPIAKYCRDMMLNILFTEKPLSARLPISYQKIPHQLRWGAASLIVRLNRIRGHKLRFPQWPIDLSIDCLRDIEDFFLRRSNSSHNNDHIAVLTHDIDTPESLENLHYFLEIEESFDMRSTIFIVPNAWELNHTVITRALKRGHEIGIHGYNHDNRTPFLRQQAIVDRIESTSAMISRYGIKGYRSPSLLRSKVLFGILENYFYYDSSVPMSGGYYTRNGNGCASARPFFYKNLLEIPLTLPSDANLLFHGLRPDEILRLWMDLSKTILKSGGIINLLTHCEKRYSGNNVMLDTYRKYLAFLHSLQILKFKTLSQVAESVRKEEGVARELRIVSDQVIFL